MVGVSISDPRVAVEFLSRNVQFSGQEDSFSALVKYAALWCLKPGLMQMEQFQLS